MDPEIELENDVEDLIQYLNESYFSVEGFGKNALSSKPQFTSV